MTATTVDSGPTAKSRADHLELLKALTDSELEAEWLEYLKRGGYRLPDRSQVLFEECGTRPDFVYSDVQTVIYVDGAPHQYPHRRARDAEATCCMDDQGFTVIRFDVRDDWDAILARYPYIFGKGRT